MIVPWLVTSSVGGVVLVLPEEPVLPEVLGGRSFSGDMLWEETCLSSSVRTVCIFLFFFRGQPARSPDKNKIEAI